MHARMRAQPFEAPCGVPWSLLTLYAPTIESLAALPLSHNTSVFLGGTRMLPGACTRA